jgi:RNA polymerase sigma-70 factor, ECF subfamily
LSAGAEIFSAAREQNRRAAHYCHQPTHQSRQPERAVDERHAIESFLESRTDEAFCALFEALYGRVRRYFLLRGADETAAEELAQNVLFIVYSKAGEFGDPALFQGWLFAVARNELAQHRRRGLSRIRTVELEPLRATLAESFTTDAEVRLREEFDELLSLLEPAERELARLRYAEGLSYDELAAALGVAQGTVKSRLFKLKEKLARLVKPDAGAGVAHRLRRTD